MTFDVWFWRQKSSNEKWEKCQESHNGHKPTVYVAAVLTINQTYNNLGLYDSVADSQMLLLNNQSIVQLEVHLLWIKVSYNNLISRTQTLATKTDFFYVGAHKLARGSIYCRPKGERGSFQHFKY